MRLSHTSMSQYLRCPQGYKLKYIDGHKELPKWFFNKGSAVHAALEAFYKGKLSTPATLEDMLAAFEAEFDPEAYETEEQRKEAHADCEKMIREFYDKYADDFQPALMVEKSFYFELEGVPLVAKVDRVDKIDDEHVRIVDYKTGQFIPPEQVDKNPQLALYQLAVEDQLGMEVECLELYHVPSQTPTRVERRGDAKIQEVRDRVVEVARGIEDEAFEPVEQYGCRWCDFKPWCCLYADEFPENHPEEPALLVPSREEANDLADRYGELKDTIKPLEKEVRDTKAQLTHYFKETGDRAAAGDEYRVTAAQSEEWRFDHEELRALLEPLGLWDLVLAPDWRLEAALRDNPQIPTELRWKLQEIAKLREGWRLGYKKRDG